jgi:hypothetical protein
MALLVFGEAAWSGLSREDPAAAQRASEHRGRELTKELVLCPVERSWLEQRLKLLRSAEAKNRKTVIADPMMRGR